MGSGSPHKGMWTFPSLIPCGIVINHSTHACTCTRTCTCTIIICNLLKANHEYTVTHVHVYHTYTVHVLFCRINIKKNFTCTRKMMISSSGSRATWHQLYQFNTMSLVLYSMFSNEVFSIHRESSYFLSLVL